MKNLKDIGCKGVVGIYRDVPFVYARDGVLGGIKQESEKIADEIVQNAWGEFNPILVSLNDFSKAYRAIEKADIVIYSCGFEHPLATYRDIHGNFQVMHHDQLSSQFIHVANVWGFGIAFPKCLHDTNYPDIGFNGFITAIQDALPAILQE